MSSYSNEPPFDASMLVHFRERISAELVNKVNQEMVSPLGGVGFRPAKVANPKGQWKRRFSLNRVMTKLAHTSRACNCYYFFSNESFYSALTAVLCFFMSSF
ncbi:hypothetical protein NUACC26_100970 [Scytonema sp. NUACC26]